MTASAPPLAAPLRPSPLDRLLRLFSDVRAGESGTALLMLANVFLLLGAYYLVKPAREGLLATAGIEAVSKTELKAYTSFGQGLLLLWVVPLYARLSRTLRRRHLVARVTLFFASNLVVFHLLQPGLLFARVPYLGIAFYLWVGIFNNLVVAQFWSFAADIYTDERGKRLFPMIAIGASAGAAAGSWISEQLSRLVGTYALLLLAAAVLGASLLLTLWVDTRGPLGGGAPDTRRPEAGGGAKRGAFRLVFGHKYLLAAALMILALNWVNTNGENTLYGAVQMALQQQLARRGLADPASAERFIADGTTAFYGNFAFWQNLLGLLLQAFVASRLLRYGGFGALLLMLPTISLLSYGTMTVFPVLAVIKAMKIAENATDYSINNTAKQVLWLPTTRAMKYEAKAAIDTIFVRVGDGLAAVTAFVGVNLLALPLKGFFAFNVVLVLAWIALGVVVVRENRRLTAELGGPNAP